MSDPSSWRAYYRSHEGRFRITGPALRVLEITHEHRVVTAVIAGRRSKALLLDMPLQLGDRVPGSDIIEYYLNRIPLRDLPGWPPRRPPKSVPIEGFSLSDARLQAAIFKRRQSPALPRVELSILHRDRPFQLQVVGPPVLLLKCLEATLRQEGVEGRKLSDLQEFRLISPDALPQPRRRHK